MFTYKYKSKLKPKYKLKYKYKLKPKYKLKFSSAASSSCPSNTWGRSWRTSRYYLYKGQIIKYKSLPYYITHLNNISSFFLPILTHLFVFKIFTIFTQAFCNQTSLHGWQYITQRPETDGFWAGQMLILIPIPVPGHKNVTYIKIVVR